MFTKRPPIDFAEFKKPGWMEFVCSLIWGAGVINNLTSLRAQCCRKGCRSKRNRALVVSFYQCRYKNFCCSGFGSALTLWKEFTGLEVYEAAVDLCKERQCPVPFLGTEHTGG